MVPLQKVCLSLYAEAAVLFGFLIGEQLVNFWLMKSEPSVYSIDDLARDGKTTWEGVRNYQARNSMRDVMKVGDMVLFYHSNCAPPGVAGLARVCREAYPDPSALDPQSLYYDPKATPANPIWVLVELEFVAKFSYFVSLEELKTHFAETELLVIRRGMRLSVQEVTPEHFAQIQQLGACT